MSMSVFEGPPGNWHYEFSHMALRIPLFLQPDLYLSALTDPEIAEALVTASVARVARNHAISQETSRDIVDHIVIHPPELFLDGDCRVHSVIIEMPPPRRDTECYFMAVTFKDPGTPYYFTLERNRAAANSTMFCSWDSQGSHLNHGEGPPPDKESFAACIARQLCRNAAAPVQ